MSHEASAPADSSTPQPAIAAERISKTYPRHFHDARTLKEILTFRRATGSSHTKPLQALHDISFEVMPGEMVGVIGSNGAGKSTLLRVIAGITPATSGEVTCRGRIGTLLELGAGFQQDFSGMENIFLSAAVMGVGREEIEGVVDDIIDFAEVRPFIHSPVNHYSTGMHVRLGFSIAVHLRPSVLLADEVLSVGDARFQTASFRRLAEMRAGGTATLVVSHDLHSVEAICDRVLWLEHGEVRGWGPTPEVLGAYRDFIHHGSTLPEMFDAPLETAMLLSGARIGKGNVTIDEFRILGPDGRITQTVRPGEPMIFEFDYTAHESIDDATLVLIVEHDGVLSTMISSEDHGFTPVYEKGRGTVRLEFDCCPLSMGSYAVSPGLIRRTEEFHVYDMHLRIHRFAVVSPKPESFTPHLRIPLEFELKMGG